MKFTASRRLETRGVVLRGDDLQLLSHAFRRIVLENVLTSSSTELRLNGYEIAVDRVRELVAHSCTCAHSAVVATPGEVRLIACQECRAYAVVHLLAHNRKIIARVDERVAVAVARRRRLMERLRTHIAACSDSTASCAVCCSFEKGVVAHARGDVVEAGSCVKVACAALL